MPCRLTSNTKRTTTGNKCLKKVRRSSVYVFQAEAEHEETKIPFPDFWWIGSYVVQKALPNNNYSVRKIGTDKTQGLHRRRLCSFTPRQIIRDAQKKKKLDPEVIIKDDDLYVSAWECECE